LTFGGKRRFIKITGVKISPVIFLFMLDKECFLWYNTHTKTKGGQKNGE